MAYLQAAFLFPSFGRPLHADGVVDALDLGRMTFDSYGRTCISIGESGFHLDVGGEFEFERPIGSDLRRRLAEGEMFAVRCRAPGYWLQLDFLLGTPNPVVRMISPPKQVDALNEQEKSRFSEILFAAAWRSKASYVVFAYGEIDFIEDRFLDIDGRRHIDLSESNGMGDPGIQEVWVAADSSVLPPEGLDLSRMRVVGGKFKAYRV